nr:unnamed protein product [Spirometra erinaceieuropaei]
MVESGVPQGSVLGPILFLIYVDDAARALDCEAAMFADDMKIWSVIRCPADEDRLQMNLNRLEEWSNRWLLRFNVAKCSILRLGNTARSASTRGYFLGGEALQEVEAQKDLGVLTTSSLKPSAHCSRVAKNAMSVLYAIKPCLEIWTRALEKGFEVDVVYIDFRKAFDTVPHQRLLHKLSDIGIRGDLLNWIRAFLVGRKQRVCIGDDMSEWVNVTSGVPQGSVLGPLLFILYVNDSLQELDCGKIMFADDVKLWQVIKGPTDQTSLQDNLHRLQAWSKK